MDSPFGVFANARVLVTGHTGFKGPWLCMVLRELGADVMGYALPAEEGSLFAVLGLGQQMRHVEADIRDPQRLIDTVAQFAPQFVFHLAAQTLVGVSYDTPRETFEANVQGSVNLLEAVRLCPSVRALVYVTSDKCYLNREWDWGYRENDRLGGHDPYSASKAAAEVVFAAYKASFFDHRPELGAATARAGNVIGGGDWSRDRIVPDCIRAVQRGEPIVLRHPSSVRPWQHVLESLSGYLLLASRLIDDPAGYGGPWNFGPDDRDIRTVEHLARTVTELWGSGSVKHHAADPLRHETRLLQLNCDKARRRLGWTPAWAFDRAITETVGWYRDVHSGASAHDVTLRQVRDYLRDAGYTSSVMT
jgi:CDP-glucose 4,6-dehydratase